MFLKYFPPQLTVLALVLCTASGCGEDSTGPLEPELRTEAVCADGVGEFDVFVERQISAIGPVGNDLAASTNSVWVVESGSNTVSRLDRETGSYHDFFVDVGNERNPYAATVDETARELWVANYASNTVSVASKDTGEILVEFEDESFENPSTVVLSDTHAYVGNVNFISLAEGYGPGSITVIDRAESQVVGVLETEFKNPQFMAVEVVDGSATLLVSSGGELERRNDRVAVVSEGGLEIFDINADPVTPNRESFALGQLTVGDVGAPGTPLLSPDGGSLYLVSGNAPVLFVFDLLEREWVHDASSPIEIYQTDGDATHKAVMDPDGLLWITAFNEDALYLFDTSCHEKVAPPIDLGRVANMLEGPQSILVVDDGAAREGYVVMTISNALGRVRLVPVEDQ